MVLYTHIHGLFNHERRSSCWSFAEDGIRFFLIGFLFGHDLWTCLVPRYDGMYPGGTRDVCAPLAFGLLITKVTIWVVHLDTEVQYRGVKTTWDMIHCGSHIIIGELVSPLCAYILSSAKFGNSR